MKILAFLIAIYTLLMLLIHVSTSKILKAWDEQPDSWISRWFPSRLALRTEALFWLLVLAAWPLWRPVVWKVLVVGFAVIHSAIWATREFLAKGKRGSPSTASPVMKRAIVAFDLVEAFVLAAVGITAALFLTQPR